MLTQLKTRDSCKATIGFQRNLCLCCCYGYFASLPEPWWAPDWCLSRISSIYSSVYLHAVQTFIGCSQEQVGSVLPSSPSPTTALCCNKWQPLEHKIQDNSVKHNHQMHCFRILVFFIFRLGGRTWCHHVCNVVMNNCCPPYVTESRPLKGGGKILMLDWLGAEEVPSKISTQYLHRSRYLHIIYTTDQRLAIITVCDVALFQHPHSLPPFVQKPSSISDCNNISLAFINNQNIYCTTFATSVE